MKYGLLFRKLVVEGVCYYQLINKIKGENDYNDVIKITEGPYLDLKVENYEKSNETLVYKEIEKDIYDSLTIEQPLYFEYTDGSFKEIGNCFLQYNISRYFYQQYHDFNLCPKYDILNIINTARDNLKKKVLGQDEVIDKILCKIYNNNILINSDLEKDEISKHKSNILVIGPSGCGKSLISDKIERNLGPIPVVKCELTGNYRNDIAEIIKNLLYAAENNPYLATQGIVIYDLTPDKFNINFLDDDDTVVNNYMEELKELLKSQTVLFTYQDEPAFFDISNLTHLCFVNMPYEKTKEENDIYYSKIASEDFFDICLDDMLVPNYFDSEIIYMNEMTKSLALKILKNKETSPLYTLKQLYEKEGKTFHFSKNFINALIDKGLSLNKGFLGIMEIIKHLQNSKKCLTKDIFLTKEDIDKLKIGSVIYQENLTEAEKEKIDNLIHSDLKVDLKNKKINNLTVLDTINKIKENIKGQDEAIFILVNAFYNHIFNKNKDLSYNEIKQLKENVLFIGSTGVGKTAIVEELARIFNMTYVREIATRYSQAGYVGSSVDDMLEDLVNASHGNMKKAQSGILYIDEIDKINKKGGANFDMGLAVQNDLLTLIEGDNRQVETKDKQNKFSFDTTGLFIIGTGAFDGLEKIKDKRIKKAKKGETIGFKKVEEDKKVDENITNQDFYEYGYDKQFIARFSHKVKLNNLSEDVIYDIISNSKTGYINLCKKSYAKSGVIITLSESFKKSLAKKVSEQLEGARGIKTIFARIKNEIDKNNQDGLLKEVIIDEDALTDLNSITYVKKKTYKKK